MLQQTQVSRVIPKYEAFLTQFPTLTRLASAELGEVLRVWQGLGYNRRAKFLWQAASITAQQFGGELPRTEAELVKLPGIGKNTAGAILAYAYNEPAVFVETNIRTVVIYHCLRGQDAVHDAAVTDIVHSALASSELSPREFYWALMDYGTHLKATHGNLNKLSKSYAKQSTFHGSRRQVRGAVLRLLASEPKTLNMLRDELPDERLDAVLADLEKESLVRFDGTQYHL